MSITCYAQRLLNPFRGVINCIRYQSAEAVTRDGLRWDIYVSNDRLLEGMETGRRVQISDIRYGNWSPETGLKRGPLYPSEDFKYLEHMGATVYEHLLDAHVRIPFPLQDCFELWLLDREARPLALLDSAVRREDIDLDQSIEWRAGQACRQSFTTAEADRLALEHSREGAAAGYLSRHINACAGAVPAAQWFERLPGGSGAGLAGINLDPRRAKRTLDAGEYPPLLLDTHHQDVVHRRLYTDFLNWQAPWLLALPTLDRATRENFESEACARPLLVAQQYRLYPEIIDVSVIRAARVEARLRKSRPEDNDSESVMPTYYIELHPSATE
jgi:hypothetical protein